MTAATVRWIHSIHALVSSSGGMTLAVAQRPVGAAHAGIRGAHDDADRDEQHRRDDGGARRASGTGSRAWVRPRARMGGTRRRTPPPFYAEPWPITRGRPGGFPGPRLRSAHAPIARRHARAARGRRRRLRVAPRPTGAPSASTAAGKPERDPGHRQLAAGRGAEPVRVLVPRPQDQPPGRLARPHGVGRVHRARPDRARARRPRPTFVWAIEGVARRLRGERRTSRTTGDWKAVFITQAPNAPQEAIGVEFRCSTRPRPSAIGQRGARRPTTRRPRTSAATSRRSRRDTAPRSGVLRDDRRGRPGGAQAVRARVRHARRSAQSAQCGPTLDRVKAVAAAAPEGRRVHQRRAVPARVHRGQLQPVLDANGQLQPVEAVNQWGLVSEPWVFTVGADGIVKGSFEGVVGDDELKAAIADIAGG